MLWHIGPCQNYALSNSGAGQLSRHSLTPFRAIVRPRNLMTGTFQSLDRNMWYANKDIAIKNEGSIRHGDHAADATLPQRSTTRSPLMACVSRRCYVISLYTHDSRDKTTKQWHITRLQWSCKKSLRNYSSTSISRRSGRRIVKQGGYLAPRAPGASSF